MKKNNPQEPQEQETRDEQETTLHDSQQEAQPQKEFDEMTLEEKVAFLTEQSEQHLSGWKRAQADYQNLKKHSEQERIELIKYGNARLLESLIPLFDNFALAMKHIPEDVADNSWTQGITFILKQMTDTLEEQGVTAIHPLGEEFNPHEHEAVEVVKSDTDPNKVIEVLQNGYKLHDKVIRTARVKVSE